MLCTGGLDAEVVIGLRVPFGPVGSARSEWLERIGLLPTGCREEELVVIKAGKVLNTNKARLVRVSPSGPILVHMCSGVQITLVGDTRSETRLM
jgi:hypothetical protein